MGGQQLTAACACHSRSTWGPRSAGEHGRDISGLDAAVTLTWQQGATKAERCAEGSRGARWRRPQLRMGHRGHLHAHVDLPGRDNLLAALDVTDAGEEEQLRDGLAPRRGLAVHAGPGGHIELLIGHGARRSRRPSVCGCAQAGAAELLRGCSGAIGCWDAARFKCRSGLLRSLATDALERCPPIDCGTICSGPMYPTHVAGSEPP